MAANKVSPGQGVGKNPLFNNAPTINSVLDLLDRGRAGLRPHRIPGLPTTSDQVKVQNLTGEAREYGEYVQLGDYMFLNTSDPDSYAVDRRYLWFEGLEPDAPLRKIAILQDTAYSDGANSDIVVAAVSGVCVAKVNVTSEDHTHARAKDGEYVLQSDGSGVVELLSQPNGTGEQLMAVRFAQAPPLKKGKLDSALNVGSTTSVTLWEYDDDLGREVETDETVEGVRDWNQLGTFSSGTLPRGLAVIIGMVGEHWYIVQVCDRMLGVTNTEIKKGSRGWVSIHTGNHTAEADTGDDVLCMNWFADVGANKRVWVDRTDWGHYLTAAECGDPATVSGPPKYQPPEEEVGPIGDGGGGLIDIIQDPGDGGVIDLVGGGGIVVMGGAGGIPGGP